ncbi:SIMPL domain-containing protein [Candidatus Kaiserbacteria bacterium]|nr:SIMPL domain-containing protein [Candidatus Kaiserbacteria bacterium]
MDAQAADKIINATYWPRMAAASALSVLALFLLAATVNELRSSRYIGSGISPTNTIYVSGEGNVFAVPDVATFSVTVQETAKDVATAQATATKKSNDIIDYLKKQGIEDKDVQTTDYSVNPHYEWSQAACPADSSYCPPGRQTLTGYDVSQTLSVKVRDTAKAGAILSGVGSLGVTNVSGLSFTVADQNLLEDQARAKAIQDAQAKAETLANQLGVTLVRVVSFSESGGPIYYAKTMDAAVGMGGGPESAPTPQLPTGQNKITSNVTVTYEIR